MFFCKKSSSPRESDFYHGKSTTRGKRNDLPGNIEEIRAKNKKYKRKFIFHQKFKFSFWCTLFYLFNCTNNGCVWKDLLTTSIRQLGSETLLYIETKRHIIFILRCGLVDKSMNFLSRGARLCRFSQSWKRHYRGSIFVLTVDDEKDNSKGKPLSRGAFLKFVFLYFLPYVFSQPNKRKEP
jgi:hypothetical protein